jgi:hypothetical protein
MKRQKAQGTRLKAQLGVRVVLGVLCLVFCALTGSACAKARAEAAPDGPPLQVPEPPARVLGPVDDPVPATAVVADPPAAAPAIPPARPPVRRPNGNAAEAERPEPAPAPAAVQAPVEPAPTETRELRAAPGVSTAAAERTIRDLLARAARDLSRVDYSRLSPDGKANYDQSKRFSQQAEQAVKDRNFVFASTLADKAATLASELLGR